MQFSSLLQFAQFLDSLGAKPAHVRKVYRAMLCKARWPTRSDRHLPKKLRAELQNIRQWWEAIARIHSRHPGWEENSERLLLRLQDGQLIESVLLPRDGVCVSTQIGCAVGCKFCMTGRSGLLRQLSDLEIVSQVANACRLRPKTKKVVFMGMGEPSHNLKNVWSALLFMAQYGEFGYKNLVLSTVGDQRLFDQLLASRIRPALAISLHTIDEDKRKDLLPKGCRVSVKQLLEFGAQWGKVSGYPVQYEWTLIAGINDSEREIIQLAEKIKGHYVMVNFIPVNRIPDSPYKRPSREHMQRLIRLIRSHGVIATIRDSAAQDVDGGCGQLRARTLIQKINSD